MQASAKTAVGILLAIALFSAGYFANQPSMRAVFAGSGSMHAGMQYTCPMHPQYRSDHPGDCPSCGMRLVAVEPPKKEGDSGEAAAAGLVQVAAAKQRLIGLETEELRLGANSHPIRALGRVVVDEDRQYRLMAGADGWVRELGPNPVGTFVRKDQILATYYTPNLIAATQTYVFAMQTNAQAQSGDATIGYQRGTTVLSLQVALDSLRSLGMSDIQIDEIRRTRIAPDKVNVYSPINGFVIARNLSPGQRFDKSTEMYRIADISRVWVLTDLFEKDREFVKPGAKATILYRGREFTARLSDALPQFDAQSRILKTRFDLDNPGNVLRPDMFVDVEIPVNLPPALTAPADAIVDSGLHQTVYVDRGNGMFEPRLVKTGRRLGGRVEVTEGIQPGERVVVAGNFLIDSESRMKAAASMAMTDSKPAAAVDPVCGMQVDSNAKNAIRTQHAGKTYVFCSEKCKKDFESAPEKYASVRREP